MFGIKLGYLFAHCPTVLLVLSPKLFGTLLNNNMLDCIHCNTEFCSVPLSLPVECILRCSRCLSLSWTWILCTFHPSICKECAF
jgi:hypothetical protein